MMKRRGSVSLAAAFLAVLLPGACSREIGGVDADEDRPVLFTAVLAGSGSGSVDVGARTRAENAEGAAQEEPECMSGIYKAMDEKLDRYLKKTFAQGDLIRICNMDSRDAAPDFTMPQPPGSMLKVFEYQWNKYQGHYQQEGTDLEDKEVQENLATYSEYLFVPGGADGANGFYLRDLQADNEHYFRFYASYSQDSRSAIQTDQSSEEGFTNSDVLLAFSALNTDKYADPFRLIFYHAFALLDIRLRLPAYDPGQREGDEQRPPSGYRMRDVKLSLSQVKTDYQIVSTTEDDAGKQVNTIELTNEVDGVDQVQRYDVPMFRYYVEDEDKEGDPNAGHDETDLVQNEQGAQEQKTTRYRTYGFCAILVPKSFAQSGENPLLELELTAPGTDVKETYRYVPPKTTSGTDLTLKSGRISVLKFRLPPNLKELMAVTAELQPWNKATGEVVLEKETEDD